MLVFLCALCVSVVNSLSRLLEGVRVKPRVFLPAIASGVLLWAAGRTNEAARYLEIAVTDRDLLPEEKTLLSRCK